MAWQRYEGHPAAPPRPRPVVAPLARGPRLLLVLVMIATTWATTQVVATYADVRVTIDGGLGLAPREGTVDGVSAAGPDGAPASGAPEPTTPAPTPTATTSRTPPPPIPGPVLLLDTHPLLAPGLALPPVDCALPRLGGSDEAIQAYHRATVACLDAVWAPALAARGLPHAPTKLVHAVDPGLTACGRATDFLGDYTAWYCDLDDTIYLPMDRIRRDAHPDGAIGHLAIVSHEYAHHVQGVSGLLLARDMALYDVPDEAAALLLERRTELQANCFGGLSLAALAGRGAVSRQLATGAVADFRDVYGSDSHGTARSQGDWARRGFDSPTTDACNTWVVPPDAVR